MSAAFIASAVSTRSTWTGTPSRRSFLSNGAASSASSSSMCAMRFVVRGQRTDAGKDELCVPTVAKGLLLGSAGGSRTARTRASEPACVHIQERQSTPLRRSERRWKRLHSLPLATPMGPPIATTMGPGNSPTTAAILATTSQRSRRPRRPPQEAGGSRGYPTGRARRRAGAGLVTGAVGGGPSLSTLGLSLARYDSPSTTRS